ncbi:MAG: hypothetical protein KGL39_37895 [Patescibacteria group bacterium]|nr:hypothetical protein [Patescibacteria group bacterium]
MPKEQLKPSMPFLSEEELGLIKATFTEGLLLTMRASFLGLPLGEGEKSVLRDTFGNAAVFRIVEKFFYPTLSKTSPIGQLQDAWLGVESIIFGQSEGTVAQAIGYKQLALEYTRKGLDRLASPSIEAVNVNYDPRSYPNDTLGIMLLARNQYVRHVESQLLTLSMIVQQKEKTADEIKKDRIANSAK